jgi:hypothetical protein
MHQFEWQSSVQESNNWQADHQLNFIMFSKWHQQFWSARMQFIQKASFEFDWNAF